MELIVIIIAHRPASLNVCDKVLVLTDGVQQAFGPRDEVLSKLTNPIPQHAAVAGNLRVVTNTNIGRRVMKPAQCDLQRSIRRLNLLGLSATVLFLGGVGGWAATAKLTGAVIGQGTLVVESSIKKVQHPNGGIVGQIFVKEGSVVKEGDVLIRLDDTDDALVVGRPHVLSSTRPGHSKRASWPNATGPSSVTFPPEILSRIHEPVSGCCGQRTGKTVSIPTNREKWSRGSAARASGTKPGGDQRTYCPTAEQGERD